MLQCIPHTKIDGRQAGIGRYRPQLKTNQAKKSANFLKILDPRDRREKKKQTTQNHQKTTSVE